MNRVIKIVQEVGEMYTRERMSRRSLNYTNGYMQAIKDVKEKLMKEFEEILEEDEEEDWDDEEYD